MFLQKTGNCKNLHFIIVKLNKSIINLILAVRRPNWLVVFGCGYLIVINQDFFHRRSIRSKDVCCENFSLTRVGTIYKFALQYIVIIRNPSPRQRCTKKWRDKIDALKSIVICTYSWKNIRREKRTVFSFDGENN